MKTTVWTPMQVFQFGLDVMETGYTAVDNGDWYNAGLNCNLDHRTEKAIACSGCKNAYIPEHQYEFISLRDLINSIRSIKGFTMEDKK